ncbi:MAG: polysaccharide biosynthesis tyrosine autokinase [Gluconobacter cerinus]|uniref:polysaccharide biosynthesis tyrosine autokinase n=1 Tax=Gluconobacter cerinus TaxID=38307 RepID=UPI0039EC27C2
MTPDAYLKIVRRYWLVLVIGAVAGVLIALGVAFVQPKMYSADSSGFITTPSSSTDSSGSSNVGMAVAGDSYAKSRAKSYADLGKQRTIAEAVIKDLGLSESPEELVNHIAVTVPVDTVTIQVSATASTPRAASDLANAWIRAMAAAIKDLESGGSHGVQPAATLEPLESAVIPTSPTSPNTRLYAALGLFAGLAIGFVFAIIRSQYDRRIRSVSDISKVTDLPIVGALPLERTLVNAESRLLPDHAGSGHDSRRSSAARHLNEALRELRTNIEFIDVDAPPRAIVVTSSLPGDGKSTVTANLATVMAETGRSVVLIDGDLRKSTVARTFGLPEGVGLTDVLAGRVTLDAAMHRRSEDSSLFILPAGSVPPNPSELLGSEAFRNLVQSFVAEGVTVLIDALPLLPVTDAAVLAAHTDGALVVASAGRTRIDTLQEALGRIASVKGKTLGIVLNRVPTKGLDKYGYGYYSNEYSYYYEKDADEKPMRSAHRKKRSHSQEAPHRRRHQIGAEPAQREKPSEPSSGLSHDLPSADLEQLVSETPQQHLATSRAPLLADEPIDTGRTLKF